MRQVTVTEKYRAVLEGNMAKGEFVRQMRLTHPQHITQFNGFDDSVQILKNRGLLFEKKKQVVEEVMPEPAALPYNDEAFQRGIRYELNAKGIEVHAGANVRLEDYDAAKEAAHKNLSKDPMHYLNLISGESSKVDKHDKPVETKRGAKDVDTFNGLKKADLRENKAELAKLLKEGKLEDLANKLGVPVEKLKGAADKIKDMERQSAERDALKLAKMKEVIDDEEEKILEADGLSIDEHEHQFFHLAFEGKYDDILEDYMSSESYKQDEKEIQNKYDVSSAHDIQYLDEWEHFIKEFEAINRDDATDTYNFEAKGIDEMLSISGNSEEEIKKNAEELLAFAKKVGLDKAELHYHDNGNVDGVELNDTVEDRNDGKTQKVSDFQDKQFQASKAGRSKQEPSFKPKKLKKLTIGGKTYEKGDFDPNDDGRIMSIEKYPNGYFITGGVYSDYGDGDGPKEGYGYAIDLKGNEMEEEDLEGMFNEKKVTELKDTTDGRDIGGKIIEFADGKNVDINVDYHRGKTKDFKDVPVEKAIDIVNQYIDQNDLTQASTDETDLILQIDDGDTAIDIKKSGISEKKEADFAPSPNSNIPDANAEEYDVATAFKKAGVDMSKPVMVLHTYGSAAFGGNDKDEMSAEAAIKKLEAERQDRSKQYTDDGEEVPEDHHGYEFENYSVLEEDMPEGHEYKLAYFQTGDADFAITQEKSGVSEKKGKDLDGDGDIDKDDYKHAKDKAIKKAMGKDEQLKEAIKKIIKSSLLNEAATAKLSDIGDKYGDYKGMQVVINDLENIVTDVEGYFAKVRERVQSSMDKIGQIETPDGMKVGAFLAPAIESAFFRDLNPVRKLSARDISLPQVKTISSADIAAARAAGDIEEQPKQTIFGINEKGEFKLRKDK